METGFIGLLIGIVATVLIGYIKKRRQKSQGIIHVDYSDPVDGPYLFLELKVPIADAVSKKRVILDVDTTKYYSHE